MKVTREAQCFVPVVIELEGVLETRALRFVLRQFVGTLCNASTWEGLFAQKLLGKLREVGIE